MVNLSVQRFLNYWIQRGFSFLFFGFFSTHLPHYCKIAAKMCQDENIQPLSLYITPETITQKPLCLQLSSVTQSCCKLGWIPPIDMNRGWRRELKGVKRMGA